MANRAEWIGRTETRDDMITLALIRRFCGTIDSDIPADTVPQGLHWCLFLPDSPGGKMGKDGHPERNSESFLPPIPLPHRMWAAGKLEFCHPLPVGTPLTRKSTINAIEEKTGASGLLCFVHLGHEIISDGITCIAERQTLVYREEGGAAPDTERTGFNPANWEWTRTLTPDEILLFRYSALTFNAHRIHYDAPYAKDAEHYPGLVVHGPLMATLLMDLAAQHLGTNKLTGFNFRALAPAIIGTPLHLAARKVGAAMEFAIFSGDGRQVMAATASL